MAQTIIIRRGAEGDLPTLALGEFGYTTDSKKLYIGNGVSNTLLCSIDLTDGGETTLHTHDHTTLSNIGTNTHDQIDTHISSTSDPHSTIPDQTGNDGKYLTTNGTSISWAVVSSSSSIFEYEIKTSNFTAEAGKYYLVDAGLTVNLPASATAGDAISFAPGGDWVTSNVTINRNGHNIEELAENLTCDMNTEFSLVYKNATIGWKSIGAYNDGKPTAYYA